MSNATSCDDCDCYQHELNFYYLLLAPGIYIDARNKGSFTRFVNHSCEPNCKTEKWTVHGETRIAVVALRDIAEGEELTFDYQWKALGSRQITYALGSSCWCTWSEMTNDLTCLARRL